MSFLFVNYLKAKKVKAVTITEQFFAKKVFHSAVLFSVFATEENWDLFIVPDKNIELIAGNFV